MTGTDKAAAIREKAEHLAGRSLGENGDALTEMAMERACRTAGLPGRLIPVPRSITAGCGMCWSAPPSARADLEALVIRERLDVDGLYAVLL